MKNLALVTIFIGCFGLFTIAQEDLQKDELKSKKEKVDRPSPEERANKKTDKMNEVLSLSEEQTTEISAINLDHEREMDAIKKDMKALKKRAKAQRHETKTGIEKVLSQEQREKLQADKEKHKLKREQKRRERSCQNK